MNLFAPAQYLADVVTYQLFQLTADSYLAEAVNFFVYDVIKITFLLIVINYLMAVTRYFLPMERVRDVLSNHRWYGFQYLLAALLGVVTPFCSCSSIPLFMGFVSVGIPLGVTVTFLIASPLVNEASLILFPALFGWPVTIVYNLTGILVAVVGGMLISRLKMEKYIQPEFANLKTSAPLPSSPDEKRPPWPVLLKLWMRESMAITRKIYPYVLLGIALGALIHGFVPEEMVTNTLANSSWWSVPMAVLLGVPLYANSVSVIPIIQALVGKGIPLGTGLAFMTAVVTLSLPEALMLKKIMRWPLLLAFFGITIVGIMIIGYGFNWLGW